MQIESLPQNDNCHMSRDIVWLSDQGDFKPTSNPSISVARVIPSPSQAVGIRCSLHPIRRWGFWEGWRCLISFGTIFEGAPTFVSFRPLVVQGRRLTATSLSLIADLCCKCLGLNWRIVTVSQSTTSSGFLTLWVGSKYAILPIPVLFANIS